MQRKSMSLWKLVPAVLLALSLAANPAPATALAATAETAAAEAALPAKEPVTVRYGKSYKGIGKADGVQMCSVICEDGDADGAAVPVTPDRALAADGTRATGRLVGSDAVALAKLAYYAYGAPGWAKAKRLYSAAAAEVNAGLAKSKRIGYAWLSSKVQAYAYMRYSTLRGLGLASENGWCKGLTKRQKAAITGLYGEIRKLKKAPEGFGAYAVRGGKKADILYWKTLKVSGVSLPASKIAISVGETKTVKASVAPKAAFNTALAWKSSNTKVATVTSKGVVKGIAKGTATITAAAKDGSGKKASLKVTVSVPKAPAAKTTITSKDASLAQCEFAAYGTEKDARAGAAPIATFKFGAPDADGRVSASVNLADGTYWVRETKAPAGYALSDQVLRIEIANSGANNGQRASVELDTGADPAIGTPIAMMRIRVQNPLLAGCKYAAYETKAAAQNGGLPAAVFEFGSPDADGYVTATASLAEGTYWVKEILPPAGYSLDQNVYRVQLPGAGINAAFVPEK